MVFKLLVIVCAFLVWGGQEYPVPPSVCLLRCGLFSLSLFMLAFGRACDLLWEEGWRGGRGVVCLCMRGFPALYLNRASPAPSSHCGLCTLILCAGTRDPLMHRWVARTSVMATLLVTYPHVYE